MNYSDFDSDGYSSNEDADYVPSGDNLSEDDINECEKEDPLHEDDSVPHPDNVSKKKRKGKDTKMRKRKIKVLKVDKDDDGTEEPELLREEVEKNTEDEDDREARQKKKSDDLWASFLSDAGSKPKDSSSASLSVQNADSSVLKVAPLNTATKAPGPSKVTITKVFDFAGEEVRVNKEVAADSKEARSYLKSKNTKQENEDDERNSSFSQTPESKSLAGPREKNPDRGVETIFQQQVVEEQTSDRTLILEQSAKLTQSAKRPTGMSSILNRIGGKKQKMNTLEKSKMDWDAYKSEEGITEDLAIHNRGKEGYVERKNFLERVDHRQFELEKAVRLSNMKQ